MKKRRRLSLFLALLLLCASCGTKTEEADGGYLLYFTAVGSHGPALDTQPYDPGGAAPQSEGTASPDPGDLVNALLSGPTQEGLVSPFPRGVALQSWEWDPEQKGNLQVRLSEQYSGLADISLTLADYCIVLTLSQLEGVESVEILSAGHTTSYRSHQVLTAAEAVLSDRSAAAKEDVT